MKKHKRWIIVGVFVVAIAAIAAGAYLFLGRDKDATVHYLTTKATVGTISQTVEADFTLSSESGTTSVALGGGAASDDTSSSTSSDSTSSSTTTSSTSSGTTLASSDGFSGDDTATVYAALTAASSADAALPESSDSGSPTASPTASPSASPTTTSTPTPTPTKTSHPTPSASGSSRPSGGSSASGGSSSSGGSTTTGTTATTTSSTSSSSSTVSGVVTRLVLPAGGEPTTLRKLLYISGKPIFAFVSDSPLWKNLSTSLTSGTQQINVASLQRALKKQGYYKKSVNGKFTTATKSAYKRWQKANGMSATGAVDVTRFVWMPTGSVLTSWTVGLGSHVSSGTALADVVSPSRLTAEALVSQADIADLKVGQKAEMTIDGYDSDTFNGRITFISSEPSSSSSSSSTSTQYSITVTPSDLPELAKSGMTGILDIVLEQRSDVLLVPTSAVSGSSSVSYVRVMQDGKPVYRQVETGMATSSYTEITSGLTKGETVVTGQYTDDATSTSTSSSSSNSSTGGILSGGGGMPAGGMPAGGGAMPAPGGGGSGQ